MGTPSGLIISFTLCTSVLLLATSSHGALHRPSIHLIGSYEKNKAVPVSSVPDSEHILEENFTSAKLACSAPYPVQWVYSGNGIPLMQTLIFSPSPDVFRVMAFLKNLTEKHTGEYKCTSTEQPDLLTSSFYIYVPGPALFSTWSSGRTLEFVSNAVLIPCSVSRPQVSVRLQKTHGPKINYSRTRFDPRRGFHIEDHLADGLYKCVAEYDGTRKVAVFAVKMLGLPSPYTEPTTEEPLSSTDPPLPSCDQSCAEKAICVFHDNGTTSACKCLAGYNGDGYTSCQSMNATVEGCQSHLDCPEDNLCYVDRVCRDPCISSRHGLECGNGSFCKTVNHTLTCACPEDSSEDEDTGCHVKLAQQAPTGDKAWCKDHRNCSETESCFADGVCRDPCEYTLHGLKCGEEASCKTINHRPACACPDGYSGDPLKRCDKISAESTTLSPL